MSNSDQNMGRYGRMTGILPVLLALGLAAFVGGGCAGTAGGPPRGGPGTPAGSVTGRPIAPAELDELTRAFADRYVGLLSSACDALKKNNPDAVQRREAQELMLNCAVNVYDIASNADAPTRVLDLVVVTTLVSQVWIDDDRAGEVFADRGEVLVRALHHGREEAWALAAQVLRPDQLDLLDYTIWDWRRHNPDMVKVSFVRFSNFAVGRGKSADADVLSAGGLFSNVGQAGQAVDEARLLTERMFYLFKRAPTLVRWETEAAKEGVLATPGVSTYLTDIDRLTDQAEQLPRHVAAERQALLAALDDRKQGVDATVANMRAALAEAKGVAASVGQTSGSLNEMLKTADALVGRFDGPAAAPGAAAIVLTARPSEVAAYTDAGADGGPPPVRASRPFDISEYTEGVRDLSAAATTLNDALKSSDKLLGSPEWDRRIEQVNRSADGRIKIGSEQGQLLVDAAFRRLYLAMGAFFALLILYRVITLLVTRRLRIVPTDVVVLGRGNGHPVGPTAATAARQTSQRGVSP
jgi:hypothetical protein